MSKKAINKIKLTKLENIVCINNFAAGVDIGSKSHFIAIPQSLTEDNVREFKCFTEDLNAAILWLKSHKINTVAMESTGIYWVSFYDMLLQNGFEVLLVNARHVKCVPGRKSDVLDCQWLQQLHSYGLLRGSFRPDEEILVLRGYKRHREYLVSNIATQIHLMQKCLSQMNIQLHNVISDITGVSGLKILRGIVSGERDIKKLASYRDKNCKNNITIIEKSLVGNYRQEHVFALTQILELYDVYHAKLAICDAEIEKVLIKLNTFDINTIKIASKANGKSRRKNEMHFNVRNELIKMVGVDITQIDGINSYSAFKIISEIGTNMSRWPTVKHFVSWLGLAPGTKISGGKIISSATKTCTNRVADVLRVAAQTLTRSHSALGSFFRRKRAQLGSPKAITATAHKLAKIIYLMLKHKTDYIDLGEHYYEKKYKESIVKNLITRAKKLGLEIVKPSDMHELVSVNR